MKEVLLELAAYHFWANERLLDAIQKLPAEVPEYETAGSYPSLRQTFEHLLWAECVWLQRLQMQEKVNADRHFDGNFDELVIRLTNHNEALIIWIQGQKDIYFDHTIAYYNSKKQYYKTPVYACLLQLFNHGTYHRGQIVAMLHQLGITKIPATDFILFRRNKSKFY